MVSGTENESSRKKRIEHGRVETSQTDRFPANEAVEARLKRLDVELARLREETGTPIGLLPHGLDKLVGSFRGDADFDAAMKLGAKWRSSFRPKRNSKSATKKPAR